MFLISIAKVEEIVPSIIDMSTHSWIHMRRYHKIIQVNFASLEASMVYFFWNECKIYRRDSYEVKL